MRSQDWESERERARGVVLRGVGRVAGSSKKPFFCADVLAGCMMPFCRPSTRAMGEACGVR